MAISTDYSIQLSGNYILIKRIGLPDVLYSKKNTIVNLSSTEIVLKEYGDNGTISIKKTDVDSELWAIPGVGLATWEQMIEFLTENTANFNTAAGGSAAKEFAADCDFPYRSPAMYNVINTLGFGVSISYIGTGTYSLDFDQEIDETKLVVMNSQGSSGNLLPIQRTATGVIFRHYAFDGTVQEVANTIQVYMKYLG